MSKTSIAFLIGLTALVYYLSPWRGVSPSAEGGPAVVITPANFEQEVIQSSQPVLAYFWAPW